MQKFSDDAKAFLQASILAAATSMTVTALLADKFPVATAVAWPAGAQDWFKVVMQDTAGNREVIYVGTRSAGSGVMGNLLRGQEGTAARNWTAGDAVILDITALDVMNVLAGIFAALVSMSAGLHVTAGGIDVDAGGINIDAGGLTIVAGGLTVTAGGASIGGKAVTVPKAVAFAAALSIDARDSDVFRISAMNANMTSFAITNPTDGQTIQCRFVEDGTGGRTFVAPANAKIAGVFETGANRVNLLTLTYYLATDVWEGGLMVVAP